MLHNQANCKQYLQHCVKANIAAKQSYLGEKKRVAQLSMIDRNAVEERFTSRETSDYDIKVDDELLQTTTLDACQLVVTATGGTAACCNIINTTLRAKSVAQQVRERAQRWQFCWYGSSADSAEHLLHATA